MLDCVFCRIIEKREPAFIVYEDQEQLAFLDKYPQSRGQLQLVPKTHYRWIYEVKQMGKIFDTAGKIIHAIIPVLGADHVTISTFGHEISHAHIWIVPHYGPYDVVRERLPRSNGREDQAELAKLLREAIAKEVLRR